MIKKITSLLFLLFLISAFTESRQEEYFNIPQGWPKPHYDFSKNPLDENKIMLGRALFYDPILSRNNTISCTSCHLQNTGFSHIDHKLSHGINDLIGNRNAPALMNLAWNTSFMWDGAVHHLDAQSLAPITNPLEMDSKLEDVISRLQQSKLYRKLFYKAYKDSLATGQHTLQALSHFMLTLVSADSKYDKVMRNEKGIIFSESENRGYKLFKNHCAVCHKEPLFTNGKFENNGLKPDSLLHDIGRMKISLNPKDKNHFKVPTLRNVEITSPYMHDGRYPNLQMVLFHYTNNIHMSETLSKPLRQKIVLSEIEKTDIINFLKTLTDEKFLHDSRFSYPRELFSVRK